jgi:hypothetical protein
MSSNDEMVHNFGLPEKFSSESANFPGPPSFELGKPQTTSSGAIGGGVFG